MLKRTCCNLSGYDRPLVFPCSTATPGKLCKHLSAVNVERARELLGVELAALVGESYERAYGDMVRVQQLTELEEVIGFSNAFALCNGDKTAADLHRVQICEMWRGRLKGVQRNVEVWQALLSVRTLVLPMAEDTHTWLKFASLCRKSGRVRWERCAALRCAVLCCAVLCCAVLCCAVLCCAVLCCAALPCAVPCRAALHLLCCAVLCCAVLCCAVLTVPLAFLTQG